MRKYEKSADGKKKIDGEIFGRTLIDGKMAAITLKDIRKAKKAIEKYDKHNPVKPFSRKTLEAYRKIDNEIFRITLMKILKKYKIVKTGKIRSKGNAESVG